VTDPVPEVVLTGLDTDGRAVLAVPLKRAVSDLRAFDTLAAATTLGEARVDPAAALLLQDWLDGYSSNATSDGHDDGHDVSTGADHEPFNTETFFGEDNWWVWWPDARQATVDFLDECADGLGSELLQEDTLIRLNRPDNPSLVPPAARDRLEAGLRDLGFDVRRWQGLAAFYAGADVNPPTGASGQGAPTGAQEGGR